MKCIYIEGKNVFANTNVEGVVNSKTDDCKIISYIESKYNIRYNSDCDTRFVQHHIYIHLLKMVLKILILDCILYSHII